MGVHLNIVAENTKANITALTGQTAKRVFYTTNTNELYYAISNGTTRLLSSLVQSIGSSNTVGLALNGAGQLTANASLSANADNILTDSVGLYVPDIKVAAGSSNYLTYNPSTRELSVSNIAQIQFVVGTEATLSAWVAANYTGSEYQESDTLTLPNATNGRLSFVHNGGGAGTSADWTQINNPDLSDSYIRGLLSGTAGVNYNVASGNFSLNLNTVDPNDLGLGTNGLRLYVRATDVRDTSGLVGAANSEQPLQSLLDALAAGGGQTNYTYSNGLTLANGAVKWGGNLTGATVIGQGTNALTFTGAGAFKVQQYVEVTGANSYFVLASPNGTRYKITIENDGTLNTITA